jgi:hypothetical protein
MRIASLYMGGGTRGGTGGVTEVTEVTEVPMREGRSEKSGYRWRCQKLSRVLPKRREVGREAKPREVGREAKPREVGRRNASLRARLHFVRPR